MLKMFKREPAAPPAPKPTTPADGKQPEADSRKPWSSLDEEESWSPLVALPGKKNLGLGRHWHFMSIQFWILTGAVYIVMVFVTGYWHYLVPQHWSLVPDSIKSIGVYLQFELPAKIPGQPFEPAQKLAYFIVIFIMAPLQIASGAAMSPSVLSAVAAIGFAQVSARPGRHSQLRSAA